MLAATQARADNKDDTLRFALMGATDLIDPYLSGDRDVTMVIGETLFDTMIYRDPRTFEHKPLLATAWRWIDPVTLEFDLRGDVVWHNGKKFSAEDVAYTFSYVLNPATRVLMPEMSNWVKSAEAVEPLKARLHLKAPFGAALEYVAQVLPILPKDLYPPNSNVGMGEKLIGTGPYRIASFQLGKGATFERNDKYFAGSPKGSPAIRKLMFRSIPDSATQIAELLSGGIDWIWRLPRDQAERLASAPGIAVTRGGTMRTWWIGMENRKPPFSDPRVRRAVAHAVDRKAMAEGLMGAGTPLLDVPCYPPQFGCIKPDRVAHYDYDPAKAKQLLAEAGYPNGFSTTLSIYRDSPDRMLAEALQGYLEAVGIRTTLQILLMKAFYGEVAEARLPLKLESYGQYNINDAAIMLLVYWAGGGEDSYHDPEIMALVNDGAQSVDQERRRTLFEQAEVKIIEKNMGVPLFIQAMDYAFNKDLDFTAWPDENPRLYMTRWK
jgi:peptide/nickel transport system substrate-binding protein